MTQRTSASRGAAPENRSRAAGAATFRIVGAAFRLAARRPAVVLVGAAVMGGAGVFAWNATMTQTARHPAPLFASAKPAVAKPEPQKRAEPVGPLTTGSARADIPTPPPRPAGGPDAIGSIIRAAEVPGKPGEAKPAEAKVRTAEAKPKQAEAKPKSTEAKAAPAEGKKPVEAKSAEAKTSAPPAAASASQPRVVSAQKALSKLGYGPISADGLLGSNTRQALEKFERDKKLPVTGSLAPRTTKQLASLSGISVE